MDKSRNYYSLISGGCAGFVEVLIMHPLDVMKTRLQIQRGPEDPNRYHSLRDCFQKMYKQEGISSFYKGILPPILVEVPKRAVKFFTFEEYKNLFGYGGHLSQPMILTMAGLCAGMTEGMLVNPFEVVKVKLQAERQDLKNQKSTMQTAREIINKDGFGRRGMSKGLTATLGRHGVFNMVYFSFYYNVKGLLPEFQDPVHEFGRKFAIGLASGTFASCVNIPFDVAKSRIQAPQPVPDQIKYKTCYQTITTVYTEEGFLALYKGLLPKILRLGPGGAIMLLVNEYVLDWLKRNY